MRVNRGEEFVIGGYTIGNPFDTLMFGYYQGDKLLYAARTRAGFTPAVRSQLGKRFKALVLLCYKNCIRQNGQHASCCSKACANPIRRVAIESGL
jgi:hypothetical protein